MVAEHLCSVHHSLLFGCRIARAMMRGNQFSSQLPKRSEGISEFSSKTESEKKAGVPCSTLKFSKLHNIKFSYRVCKCLQIPNTSSAIP